MKVGAPSTAEITILRQSTPEEERLNVHLLHYVPQRRTSNLDLVTDIIPLHDITLAVRLPARPRRVYLAPQDIDLSFDWDGEYATCRVPRVDGHQIVCAVRN